MVQSRNLRFIILKYLHSLLSLDAVHLIISLAAQNKLKIYQTDVKSTFLNGALEEEVYVEYLVGTTKDSNSGA